jgi:hypothetical protein
MEETWENLKDDISDTKDKIMNTLSFSGFGGSSGSSLKYGAIDISMYLISVVLSIMLIQKLVPMNASNPIYRNLRIVLYILAVLGGGYPLLFLIVLYLFKMQLTRLPGA